MANEMLKKNGLGSVVAKLFAQLGIAGTAGATVIIWCLNYVQEKQTEITNLQSKIKILQTQTEDRIQALQEQVEHLREDTKRSNGAQWNVIRNQQDAVNDLEVGVLTNERLLDKMMTLRAREKDPPGLVEKLLELGSKDVRKPTKVPRKTTKEFRRHQEDKWMMQQQAPNAPPEK